MSSAVVNAKLMCRTLPARVAIARSCAAVVGAQRASICSQRGSSVSVERAGGGAGEDEAGVVVEVDDVLLLVERLADGAAGDLLAEAPAAAAELVGEDIEDDGLALEDDVGFGGTGNVAGVVLADGDVAQVDAQEACGADVLAQLLVRTASWDRDLLGVVGLGRRWRPRVQEKSEVLDFAGFGAPPTGVACSSSPSLRAGQSSSARSSLATATPPWRSRR